MGLCLWGDCTRKPTEALDHAGRGLCKWHADYLQEYLPNRAPCLICRVARISIGDGPKEAVSTNQKCSRCHGTGIEPACVVKDIYGQLRDLGFSV